MKNASNAKTIRRSDIPKEVPEEAVTEAVLETRAEAVSGAHIEAADAESFIAEKRIGARIRNLRLKKSMGLVELGNHTGLSASFLSQLETGRVVPTLRNLARIAMVFSKDLSYFFEPEPMTLFRAHLAKDRIRLPQSGVEDPMYFFESLGYLVPDRQMDPYLAMFQPKPGRKPRTHHHSGCEFLYVLEGSLTIQHGETVQQFNVGDAVYFDAGTVHSYSCTGDTPATALIVTLAAPASGMSVTTSGNFAGAGGPRRFGATPLTMQNQPAMMRRTAQ